MNINTNFDAPFGPIPSLRLTHVPRWGIIKMAKEQSVAEHVFGVILIAEWLCKLINRKKPETDVVLNMALHHDDDEIYTGDIPSPAKIRHEKSIESSMRIIVKLADILESLRFFEQNCIDTPEMRRWLRYKLKNSLKKQLGDVGIGYEYVSCIFEVTNE